MFNRTLQPFICILIGLVLSACASVPPLAKQDSNQTPHQIIPLRTLFANVETNKSYKISPDGSQLAWLEVAGDKLQLWVKNLTTQQIKQIKTPFVAATYSWADNNRYIIFPVYSSQLNQTKLALIDTQIEDLQFSILLEDMPGSLSFNRLVLSPQAQIILKHVEKDKTPAFFQVDVHTKTKQRLPTSEPDIIDLLSINKQVQVIHTQSDNLQTIKMHDNSTQSFKPVFSCETPQATVSILSLDQQGFVYFLSNCETDTTQLFKVGLTQPASAFCQRNQDCLFDIEQVITHPQTGLPLFGILHAEQSQFIDFSQGQYLGLNQLNNVEGTVKVDSFSHDLKLLTLSNQSALGEQSFLLDSHSLKMTALNQPALNVYQSQIKQAQFINVAPAEHPPVYGYYYPAQVEFASHKPAVILIHGGPHYRSYADYDKEAILLANRGYHVVSINYRGSKGFGRHYQQQAYNNINFMLDDINNTAKWLEQHIQVDPQSIALMGASFGGYLSLLGGQSPQYQCIVSINGLYDLEKTARDFPFAKPTFFDSYFSGLDTIATGVMDPFSPSKYNHYQDKQFLLIHSLFDKRIAAQTAIDFHKKIQDSNQTQLVLLKDNHSISKWYNNLETYRHVETFLSDCLGGIDAGFEYYLWAKPFYE